MIRTVHPWQVQGEVNTLESLPLSTSAFRAWPTVCGGLTEVGRGDKSLPGLRLTSGLVRVVTAVPWSCL